MSKVQDIEDNSFYSLLSATQKGDLYAKELLETKLQILKGALMRNIQKAHSELSMDSAMWIAELQMGEEAEMRKSIKNYQMDALWDVFREELAASWKVDSRVDDFWGILSRIGGQKFVALVGHDKRLKFEASENLVSLLKMSPTEWGCLFLMQNEMVGEFLGFSDFEDIVVTVRVPAARLDSFGVSRPEVELSTFTAFVVRDSVVHVMTQDYLEKSIEKAGWANENLSCCSLMEFDEVRLFLRDKRTGSNKRG